VLTPTHLLTAQVAYLSGCIFSAHPPNPAESLVALGAALIPDLDSRQSTIGRALPFLSGALEYRFGHRTLTHSLLAQVTLGALAWSALPFGYFLAMVAGWISHSLADMMTPSGVVWLWPARGRCVLPGNVRYRMETLGKGELGFLLVMAVTGLLLMPLARTGEGTTGLIRSAIGDLLAAREQYDAGKGSHAYRLEIKGRDNRRFSDISGTYPVIGPYQEGGFLLDTPEGPRTLCRSGACDWHPDHAALIRGAPEETRSFPLRVPQTTPGALLGSLTPLQSAGKVYLLGTLEAPGLKPVPPTLEVAGDRVTLGYATPEILDSWGRRALRNLDLTVQVRHPPGGAVPELAHLGPGTTELHPLLGKWVESSQ